MNGLEQTPFIHEKALCESKSIASGTRVRAFAHILPAAIIGAECDIWDGVFIENDVHIGDSVTIKCGVQIWDGTRIGNDVFIGLNKTFTYNAVPRSKKYLKKFSGITLEDGASIGANATLLPGIRIGAKAMVGAGAAATKDVPPESIEVGNPAKVIHHQN